MLFRSNNVRGPLTGWTVSDSTYINKGTDVVLVEVDDEAYRLLPEEWPYPRGSVWGRVVRNLDKAGAKGTGKWMSQLALDLGAPSTLVTSALYARGLSALMQQRVRASEKPSGPTSSYDGST